MQDEPEAPQDLSNKAIIAQLIKVEKLMEKLVETNMVLIHQTIQGNKLSKKSLFLQFNVKELTLPEIEEEYAQVKAQIERDSDKTKNLAKQLMLGNV